MSDQLEIAVDEEDFLIGTGLTQHLAGGIECDAVAVIHVVAFLTGAVQARNKIFVENSVCAQLLLPDFAREGLVRSGAWNEYDFRAVERERTRSFGIVAIMTDQDSDLAEASVKYRVAEITGLEVELLLKDGVQRDMVLAIDT